MNVKMVSVHSTRDELRQLESTFVPPCERTTRNKEQEVVQVTGGREHTLVRVY